MSLLFQTLQPVQCLPQLQPFHLNRTTPGDQSHLPDLAFHSDPGPQSNQVYLQLLQLLFLRVAQGYQRILVGQRFLMVHCHLLRQDHLPVR